MNLYFDEDSEFEIPSIQEILLLRQNKITYKWFCNTILPEVVGNREFFSVCNYEKLSKITTTSDEAFAIICFENYFESIMFDVKEKTNFHTANINETDDITKRPVSLYTKAGATPHERMKNGAFQFSGWTYKGIERFNNIYDRVKIDREVNKEFDDYFLNFRVNEMMKSNKKPLRNDEKMNES